MNADRPYVRQPEGGIVEIRAEDVGLTPNRTSILNFREILALSPPPWQIKSILTARSFNLLYGLPGSGKTFVALDLALCIATGQPWCGYKVLSGPVLYVAGEGLHGLCLRLRAWIGSRIDDKELIPTLTSNFMALRSGLSFLSDDAFDRFLDDVTGHSTRPQLVVVDTLARAMGAGDENNPRDMGHFIRCCDRIREEIGAAVLVLHHPGKDGTIERGHSSLRGAADTIIALRQCPDRGDIELTCEKQKDAEPFKPLKFRLEVRNVGQDEEGNPLTSCVVTPVPTEPILSNSHPILRGALLTILRAMRDLLPTGGATSKQIHEASGVAIKTVYRHLNVAMDKGYVSPDDAGRARRFKLTAKFSEVRFS